MGKELKINNCVFRFVVRIHPNRDSFGNIEKNQYFQKITDKLNPYGAESFCTFKILSDIQKNGVLLFMAGEEIIYIGSTKRPLEVRINNDFGKIDERNCKIDGQETNCKVNSKILDYFEKDIPVYLYFFESNNCIKDRNRFIKIVKPKLNDRNK